MPHKLWKISAWYSKRFSVQLRKTHGGCINSPPLARVKGSAHRSKFHNPNGYRSFAGALASLLSSKMNLHWNLRHISFNNLAKTCVSMLRSLFRCSMSTWWRYKEWHITELIHNIMIWQWLSGLRATCLLPETARGSKKKNISYF